jgi:predicted DNA-binding transcriptional regulator AlpA
MWSPSTEDGRVVRFRARPGSEPLATKAQLAEHLQVHPRTIDRRVEAGMPCIRVGARAVRFRISECEAWLEAQV